LKELDGEEEGALGAAVRTLWTHGAQADAEELLVVATVLEAAGTPGAIPALAQLRQATSDEARARALGWALASAYSNAGQWDEALALGAELSAGNPSSAAAFRLQAHALEHLERMSALRSAAEVRLHASPSDADGLRALAFVAMNAGDGVEAWSSLHELTERGTATAVDLNNLAWSGLRVAPTPPDQVELAQKAVALTKETRRPALHTLATVYAANGRPAEALQVLIKAIDLDQGDVTPDDWLVIGRVAEHYGLLDDALDAYRRVPTSSTSLMSSGAFAKAWSERAQGSPR
jgi:thioredoxin-like negative regulator of GroEL